MQTNKENIQLKCDRPQESEGVFGSNYNTDKNTDTQSHQSVPECERPADLNDEVQRALHSGESNPRHEQDDTATNHNDSPKPPESIEETTNLSNPKRSTSNVVVTKWISAETIKCLYDAGSTECLLNCLSKNIVQSQRVPEVPEELDKSDSFAVPVVAPARSQSVIDTENAAEVKSSASAVKEEPRQSEDSSDSGIEYWHEIGARWKVAPQLSCQQCAANLWSHRAGMNSNNCWTVYPLCTANKGFRQNSISRSMSRSQSSKNSADIEESQLLSNAASFMSADVAPTDEQNLQEDGLFNQNQIVGVCSAGGMSNTCHHCQHCRNTMHSCCHHGAPAPYPCQAAMHSRQVSTTPQSVCMAHQYSNSDGISMSPSQTSRTNVMCCHHAKNQSNLQYDTSNTMAAAAPNVVCSPNGVQYYEMTSQLPFDKNASIQYGPTNMPFDPNAMQQDMDMNKAQYSRNSKSSYNKRTSKTIPSNQNSMQYNPNALPCDQNKMQYNPNALPCDQNKMQYNPNAMPSNQNNMQYNPNAMPTNQNNMQYNPNAMPPNQNTVQFQEYANNQNQQQNIDPNTQQYPPFNQQVQYNPNAQYDQNNMQYAQNGMQYAQNNMQYAQNNMQYDPSNMQQQQQPDPNAQTKHVSRPGRPQRPTKPAISKPGKPSPRNRTEPVFMATHSPQQSFYTGQQQSNGVHIPQPQSVKCMEQTGASNFSDVTEQLFGQQLHDSLELLSLLKPEQGMEAQEDAVGIRERTPGRHGSSSPRKAPSGRLPRSQTNSPAEKDFTYASSPYVGSDQLVTYGNMLNTQQVYQTSNKQSMNSLRPHSKSHECRKANPIPDRENEMCSSGEEDGEETNLAAQRSAIVGAQARSKSCTSMLICNPCLPSGPFMPCGGCVPCNSCSPCGQSCGPCLPCAPCGPCTPCPPACCPPYIPPVPIWCRPMPTCPPPKEIRCPPPICPPLMSQAVPCGPCICDPKKIRAEDRRIRSRAKAEERRCKENRRREVRKMQECQRRERRRIKNEERRERDRMKRDRKRCETERKDCIKEEKRKLKEAEKERKRIAKEEEKARKRCEKQEKKCQKQIEKEVKNQEKAEEKDRKRCDKEDKKLEKLEAKEEKRRAKEESKERKRQEKEDKKREKAEESVTKRCDKQEIKERKRIEKEEKKCEKMQNKREKADEKVERKWDKDAEKREKKMDKDEMKKERQREKREFTAEKWCRKRTRDEEMRFRKEVLKNCPCSGSGSSVCGSSCSVATMHPLGPTGPCGSCPVPGIKPRPCGPCGPCVQAPPCCSQCMPTQPCNPCASCVRAGISPACCIVVTGNQNGPVSGGWPVSARTNDAPAPLGISPSQSVNFIKAESVTSDAGVIPKLSNEDISTTIVSQLLNEDESSERVEDQVDDEVKVQLTETQSEI